MRPVLNDGKNATVQRPNQHQRPAPHGIPLPSDNGGSMRIPHRLLGRKRAQYENKPAANTITILISFFP